LEVNPTVNDKQSHSSLRQSNKVPSPEETFPAIHRPEVLRPKTKDPSALRVRSPAAESTSIPLTCRIPFRSPIENKRATFSLTLTMVKVNFEPDNLQLEVPAAAAPPAKKG
jgi:hypothetical protein